jgi:protease YdgD
LLARLALCLSIFAYAGTAQAVESTAPGLSNAAVGQILVGDDIFCMGTLVGADLVMTAAHCVQPSGARHPVKPDSVLFIIPTDSGQEVRLKAEDIASDPEFFYEGAPSRDDLARDVALIRLTKVAPRAHEALSPPNPAQTVLGLLPERKDAAFAGEPCKATYQDSLVVLECDRSSGASGAPIFTMMGGRKVVGIVSASGQRGNKMITFGVAPLSVLSNLKWLKRDRGIISRF